MKLPEATGSRPVPDGVLAAFAAYERALRANDLPVLQELFAREDDTARVDAGGVQFGWDEISAFRRSRAIPAGRTVVGVHTIPLDEDVVVVAATTERPDGGRGMQSQVWVRTADGWRVRFAHVAPAATPDRSIWRLQLQVPAAATGPLDGERVAVKDLFAVAGHSTGLGVPVRADEGPVADASASAVESLRRAGAALVGIAQLDEFAFGLEGANPHFGIPRNAADPSRLPGGSSGGPASAVGLGEATIGLGSDTAGSVRVPASYQGLWGLRATHDLVDRTGMTPLAPTFDTVGWITRDPATLAAVTALHAGPDPSARPEAVTIPALTALADADVVGAISALTDALDARPLSFDLDAFGTWFLAFRLVQSHEAWTEHGAWITAHPGVLSASVETRFRGGSTVEASMLESARRVLGDARARIGDLVDGRALVLPAAAGPAPRLSATADALHDARDRTLRLNAVASIAGLPSVSAPVLRVRGLPVGISVTLAAGRDRQAVRMAAELPRLTGSEPPR